MGRRRRPPLVFSFTRRGAANSGCKPAASNPGLRAAQVSVRREDPGIPSLGAERAAAPCARRGSAAGRAWCSGARGPEGAVVSRRPQAVPKRGLLQVGEGEITIGVFTRCTGALEGLDACCWVSYSPWNSLSPCPIPSVGCQPEARAIRGGGTPRSVSLSPSMWVRGRSAYQVSSLHQTIGSGSRFFGEFWRLLTLASHTGCQERYTAGVYAGGRCLGGRRVSRPPGLPGGRSTGHRPFP